MANPKSTAQIGGHPVHAMIVHFPITLYFAVLVADIIFAVNGQAFWAVGAFWLLVAGVVMSGLAALFGFVDFFGSPEVRRLPAAWWHMGANLLVAVVSITDLGLRYLKGAVEGSHQYIGLSILVALLLLFSAWKGGELVYRHHVGVRDLGDTR